MFFVFLAAGVTSCTWSSPEEPPNPSDLARATLAIRTGDYSAFLAAANKTKADQKFYTDIYSTLDPEAFLLTTGARDRQFDLAAIVRDISSTGVRLENLGFTEQALRTDILNATNSTYTMRAGGKKYYRKLKAPYHQVPERWPSLPESMLARRVKFSVANGPRIVTVCFTQSSRGLESLQAYVNLGTNKPKEIGPDVGLAKLIEQSGLQPTGEFQNAPFELEITTLSKQGTIVEAVFKRSTDGWLLANNEQRTLVQRLGKIRDERLKLMGRRAKQFEKTHGQPKRLEDFQNYSREVIDPTAPAGKRNWASWAPVKAAQFKLSSDDGLLIESLSKALDGKIRAVNKDGQLVWK
ncbi:MAG: hypothetical protein L3J82_05565 [Planctomycetes bacterium]|nr:hypothetical protein [Planctomycetota bacterium]